MGRGVEKGEGWSKHPGKLEHLAEDVLQNATVMIVGDFFGGIDASDD